MEISTSQDVIHEALVELYLSVKLRSSDEIENYNESKLEEELESVKSIDSLLLIKYIKDSIEIIMSTKQDEPRKNSSSESSLKEYGKGYEEQLQNLEAEVRIHIAVT